MNTKTAYFIFGQRESAETEAAESQVHRHKGSDVAIAALDS